MRHTTYLFDFDYTLADSSKGIVICFQNVLKNHGYNNVTDEEVKRTIGKTLEDSFSILTGELNMEILQKYKKLYEQEANQYMTINTFLYPETLTVLQTLKKNGAKLGIISTKYRYRIKDLLSNYLPDGSTARWISLFCGSGIICSARRKPRNIASISVSSRIAG